MLTALLDMPVTSSCVYPVVPTSGMGESQPEVSFEFTMLGETSDAGVRVRSHCKRDSHEGARVARTVTWRCRYREPEECTGMVDYRHVQMHSTAQTELFYNLCIAFSLIKLLQIQILSRTLDISTVSNLTHQAFPLLRNIQIKRIFLSDFFFR